MDLHFITLMPYYNNDSQTTENSGRTAYVSEK